MKPLRLFFVLSLLTTPIMSQAAHKIASPSLDETPQIGQGYDPIAERFTGNCLRTEGGLSYSGVPAGNIVMSRVSSQEQLEKTLGFSVNSKARFGMVTAKLAAEFLNQSGSNSYSDSVTFENAIGLKQVNLDLRTEPRQFLTSAALNDLKEGLFRRSTLPSLNQRFETACGEEYVRSITRGAKLFITVKIEFASSYDKTRFGGELNVSGGFNELSAKIQQASSKVKASASITVSALQIGGDPTQLGQIISPNPEASTKRDSNAVNAFLRCSLSNTDACTEFLDGVIKYATSNNSHSFRTQITPEYDPRQAGNGAADLDYITAPWSDLHLVLIPTILQEELGRLRKELSQLFERQLRYNTRVLELLSGKIALSEQRRLDIERLQRLVNASLDEITQTATRCYADTGNTSLKDCKSAMTDLRKYLIDHKVDESILSISVNPSTCGKNCTLCIENQCLRCLRKVGDWNLGPLTPGISQPGPTITCENMPRGELVSYAAIGPVSCSSFNADGTHGNFWLDLSLSVTGGKEAVARNGNGTTASIPTAMYSDGIVPADGKVSAAVFPGTVQAWPVIPGSVIYDPSYTLEIEARELIKRMGY